jgi:hypothetical protein
MFNFVLSTNTVPRLATYHNQCCGYSRNLAFCRIRIPDPDPVVFLMTKNFTAEKNANLKNKNCTVADVNDVHKAK